MNLRCLVRVNLLLLSFIVALSLYACNQESSNLESISDSDLSGDNQNDADTDIGDNEQSGADGSVGTTDKNDGTQEDNDDHQNNDIPVNGDEDDNTDNEDTGDGSVAGDDSDKNVEEDDNNVIPEPKPNPEACIKLDQSAISLQPEGSAVLVATYVPRFENDDNKLIWSSSNPTVVKVDDKGRLQALTVGEAVITCTDKSGILSDSCTVTVKLTWQNYSYDFKADLSEYEWAMNPESDAYVFLVNKDNPLDKNYAPSDLVDIRDTRTDRDKQKMRKIAEAALHALYLEAKENDILYVHKQLYSDGYYYNNVLSVTSAYRSFTQQANNFNNKVNSILSANSGMSKEEAEAIAATTINRAGTSEHQTGLCVDMHNYRYAEKEIAEEFGQSVAGTWLAENCYKFGFILRYEADKTDITGIAYESWHFRYVGRYHATRMHELDMCLEEYTEYLNAMGYEFDLAE